MSKRVLAVSSSPRKGGNSEFLCEQFVKGAQEAGHVVETVVLREKEIGFCSGCGACQRRHGLCVLRDDMKTLLDKAVAADVVVLATPVYFYSMCARLKAFIDRFSPRYEDVSNKKLYLIATAADSSESAFDGTIAGFRGFLDCLPGSEEAGLLLGAGLHALGDAKKSPFAKAAFEMGGKV